jgi:hypothetical protein
MDKIHSLLRRWGDWARSDYVPDGALSLGKYERSSRGYDPSDEVALLVDRAIASLPPDMIDLRNVLKARYLYRLSREEDTKNRRYNREGYAALTTTAMAYVFGWLMARGVVESKALRDLLDPLTPGKRV